METVFKHLSWQKNIVRIDWDLGNACNLNCSYCPLNSKAGNYSNPNWGLVSDFAEKMLDHYDSMGKMAVIGFGGSGEPTIVEWFPNLLRMINNRVVSVTVGTNLTAPLEWWEDNCGLITNINATVHYEHTSLRNLYNTIMMVNDQSKHLNIGVPMLPSKFNEQLEDMEWFTQTTGIHVSPQILLMDMYGGGKWINYTPEQKLKLENWYNSPAYTISNQNDQTVLTVHDVALNESDHNRCFTNWTCNAGIDTLVIDSRGMVRKSWCAQMSNEQRSMVDWIWDRNPVTCNMLWCRSPSDLMAMKIKN